MAKKDTAEKESPAAAVVETPVVETPTPEAQPGITAPRKRGRPPKAAPANGEANPVTDDGGPRKGPGRPRKGKKGVSFSSDDISTLAKQVQGLHQLAAIATGIPELAITAEESQMLGMSIANVAQEYDLALDGKTGALLQLAAACGMIYVPRFFELKKRVIENQAKQKAALHVVGGTEATSN